MPWLAQNWIWIALVVGAFFLVTRMGRVGGCGMGHSGHRHRADSTSKDIPPAANDRISSLFDPVSGRPITAGSAPFSTVYRGRGYYFESRENRDAFEAQPDKYLAGSQAAGQAIESEAAHRDRPRRRHG